MLLHSAAFAQHMGGRSSGVHGGVSVGAGGGVRGSQIGSAGWSAAPAAPPGTASGMPGGLSRAPGWSAGRSGVPAMSPPGITTYIPNIFGSASGFGNVVFPGTGHAPGTFSPFTTVDPGFAASLANTVGGFGVPSVNGAGGFGRFHRPGNAVIIPYAVPVYVPYDGYYPPAYGPYPPVPAPLPDQGGYDPQAYGPPPPVVYVVPGNPGQAPQGTAAPVPPQPQSPGAVTYIVPQRDVSASAPESDAQSFYLIALKNNSIYPVTAYWVQNGVLHYVTTQGAQNQIPLDQLDLDFTIRLNRDRGVAFRLPQ